MVRAARARSAIRLVGVVLLCAFAPLSAQTIVPVEQEPMHRAVFENDLVRVIDASLPAGHATLFHTHARDNVPVAVAAGRVAITPIGGVPVESVVTLGQVSFAAGGYTHVVRNIGTTPLHFIDVELRTSAPVDGGKPPTAAAAAYGHTAVLSNARVIVSRVVLAPGKKLDAHRHAGPVLEVVVTGDAVTVGNGPSSPVTAGGYRWHGDGGIDAVANAGRATYEVVEVEWIK